MAEKYTEEERAALAELVGSLAAETEIQADTLDQMLAHLTECENPQHRMDTARTAIILTFALIANNRILVAAAFELSPANQRLIKDPLRMRDEYRARIARIAARLEAAPIPGEVKPVEPAAPATEVAPDVLPEAKIDAVMEAPTTMGFVVPGTKVLN